MIMQIYIETAQSLYFPHSNILLLVILSFIILISVGLTAVYFLRMQNLSIKLKIILLTISFIFGGFILGGVPNVVLVIQHIFADIRYLNLLGFLIIRILIFLGLTLIFGRIFCGYVCPLGAMQELASLIRFKPKLNYNRKFWKKKSFLRWGFFVIYAISSVIWGLEATLFMNPFNGFLVLWSPLIIILSVSFPILLLTFFISIFIYRPYCRFLCPFGALANIFGKFSPLKIRRTEHCVNCGICEKICPTLEGYEFSSKAECYYCARCIDFCTNEMFIDNDKLAQLNRLLTTYSLKFDPISKSKSFDKIIKSIIRLIVPYKRKQGLEQLIAALKDEKEMSLEAIQSIITRLKNHFPEQIKQLDITIYKEWIEQNESIWKERIEPIHLDKIFYGLKKET